MIQNISFNRSFYNNFSNKHFQSPSFGTTNRIYETENGDTIGCNSWLFRNDVDWKKLAKYEISHFASKDKVNIVMFAASDGSEGYSKIISLFEAFDFYEKEKAQKFFPIIAYDIDDEIIAKARSGLINTCMEDRMNLQIHCENYEDYFSHTAENLEISSDTDLYRKKTLKAKSVLTDNIRFNKGDMFEKIQTIKDDSNTILMCRNILGYFEDEKIEKFIKLASQNLKTGSLFVIGDHDTQLTDVKSIMNKYGFEEVMKNVYKKAWKRIILLI